jgi:hypothetical protein
VDTDLERGSEEESNVEDEVETEWLEEEAKVEIARLSVMMYKSQFDVEDGYCVVVALSGCLAVDPGRE